MSNGRIAIHFSNCMGNFVLMTSALKLLRESHDKIDLITDDFVLDKYPAVKLIAEEFFDDILTCEPPKDEYDKIYTSVWSRPSWLPTLKFDWSVGVSEVHIYLDMIDKSKDDFDGFLVKTADKPVLEGTKLRIVLANASVSKGSRAGCVKSWDKFPQLSDALIKLGFDVILVGQGDELKDCNGMSFIDELDIFETSFVISQCDLMICADTGLMHIADALKVPIVLLAGPTLVTKNGPVQSNYKVVRRFISCAPCYQTGLWNLCKSPQCMKMIEVEDVLSKVFSFHLRDAYFEEPEASSYSLDLDDEKFKIVIPYYVGCDRVEHAKRTWLYPEVVFALSEPDVKIPEDHFYDFENGMDLGLSDRKKPLLKPILRKLLDKYPDNDYYGFFNSDVILPSGKNVSQLLPEKGKVAAVHHRLDLYSNGTSRRYVGKDGFIFTKDVLLDLLNEFPDVILGAGGWDGGLFYWLWGKYGEENIDIRFDEILHYDHERNWKSGDKDTDYNRIQVRSFKFFVNWAALEEKYGDIVRDQSVREILGIVQPHRLGDIIIILPIARWYFDRGYEIWWSINHEYMWLQHYVNYVKFIDNGELKGGYDRALKYATQNTNKVLDLGMGIGREITESTPFDVWKYKEAGVPFEERRNLQINRDYEREDELKKVLKPVKPYKVVHSQGSSIKYFDFKIPDGVQVRPIKSFTLFDWTGILEEAESFYGIDSSVTNLVEGLNLLKGKRSIKFNDNLRGGINTVQISHDWKSVRTLPVHFFTLVWNGMPFIKYHLPLFEKLSFNWHWHIIEGPAPHGQDKGSQGHEARGGSLPEGFDDGTLNYLDEISKHPQVTVYPRKSWNGKVDMANAPLENLKEKCILWQIDSDELYSLKSLEKAYKTFSLRPDKNVGILNMYQFVGPNKYVIHPEKLEDSIDTWGTHKYPRLWKFEPGLTWISHAPPSMSFKETRSFEIDVSFYHYSYVYEQQLKFKGSYYGYGDFTPKWKELQETEGKVMLGQYFLWLKNSNVIADDWHGEHLINL